MPELPPAIKPPMVAVRFVLGWKRSSPAPAARVWRSISISFAPAWMRARPGRHHSTWSSRDRSSTTPPCKGMAWP